jgi:hypothetical protein
MNAQRRERLRRAKISMGIVICSYEVFALAVDDATKLPPITSLCHSQPVLAAACVGWTAQHLLRPWIPRVRRA